MKLLRVVLLLLTACSGGDAPSTGGDDPPAASEALVARVKITTEAVALAGIRAEPVSRRRLLSGVEVPAEVALNPDRTAHVRSPVEGPITEVRVTVGSAVTAGDILVVVRSVAAGEARAATAEARAHLEVAQAAVARQEELARAGVGAQRNLIEARGELRSAEAEMRSASERARLYGGSGAGAAIKSPLDGQVLERHATVGELVHADDELFMVGDLSTVWIVGRVYAQDVGAARVGVPVRLSLEAYPGRTWEGAITFVAARLDPDTRTLEVRLELPNDGTLRPGLFGTLSLPPAGSDASVAVVAVPVDAVMRIKDRSVVFREEAPGEYLVRPVRLGATGGGLVEIREGLAEGERVVVEGAFTLKSKLLEGEVGEE